MGTSHPDDLVREIEATRERLAHTIDQLTYRTNPKVIAQRSLADLKAKFVAPDGSLRYETVVPVVLGVVGTVAGIVVLRRVVR